MLPSEVDIRQIDTEFGPLRKWDRKKLIEEAQPPKKVYHSDIRLALSGDRTGRRYNTQNERLKQITQKLAKQEQLAEVIYGPQYIEEKDFGNMYVSPAIGHPHPTNVDLDIPSDFTSQTVNAWKRTNKVDEYSPCPYNIPNHNCNPNIDHQEKGKVSKTVRIS